ncbi:MAG: hypothetical protein JWL85_383 [Candidatus Saccharibacteria bacterium]|nr:hypothetical protein [Candidatus Saccharibacteria bacterium]
MAEESKNRRIKKPETVRERAEKAASGVDKKPRRLGAATAGKIASPVRNAARLGKKEYYLPLPDNRVGRFLNKKRSFIPKFFREAWQELRQVNWPNRQETTQLTIAVFIFAIVFGLLIAGVDFVLGKIFKELLT